MAAPLVQFFVGIAALLAGRQLFWFFVGAVGFFVGLSFATSWFGQLPPVFELLIAIGLGVVFALLAVLIQRPMAAIAGFLAAGLFLLSLAAIATNGQVASPPSDPTSWGVFIVGGVIGAIIVLAVFDWALIVLSSMAGANIIIEALQQVSAVPPLITTLLFLVMVLVGIWVQSRALNRPIPVRRS